jgi:hypothetical protein
VNSTLKLKKLAPQFVVRDVVKTAEYYRDQLGFTILGYFKDPPVYAMVARDEVEIHFGKADTEKIQMTEDVRRGLGTTPTFGCRTSTVFSKNCQRKMSR